MLKKSLMILVMTGIALTPWVGNAAAQDNRVQELEWSELVPEGADPDALVEEYLKEYNIDEMADDDPILVELMRQVNKLRNRAPINPALNGKLVKLPGYVVPLETDGRKSTEFLLVPYYGACIHVPPPPANQTVYVTTRDKGGAVIRKLFDIVWVTGVMKAEKLSTDLAEAGYTLEAIKVEPYEE